MRLLILQRFLLAGVALIWVGLFTTQILHGSEYRRQAEKNRIRLIHLPAPRGSILDRHGIPLVEDRLSFELAVFPQELKNPKESLGRLTPVVGIPASQLEARYRRRYQAPFSPVPLIRDLPAETAFLLEEKRSELTGTLIRPVPRRHYSLGAALGPVCGYLGLIAPEELTHLKPYGYSFRDFVGKDGLERTVDSFLRGRDGGLQVEVDSRGRMVRQLGFLSPRPGRRITISLDGRVQSFCHRLLGGDRGAIVVMDASTGELLALASSPSYDPNDFVSPAEAPVVRRIFRDPDLPMFNRAIRSAVPPGSTFKVAVAYQALKEKKIGLGTEFLCPGFFKLGTSLFRCWKPEGHGPQNLLQALEHSCNVFFYQTGRRIGAEGISQAAHAFGLGQGTGIDLPREAKGLVPDPQWMQKTLKQPWQEGDTISFAIGQGPLLVTPLQMLTFITAVAMDGVIPQPHLLIAVEGEPAPTRQVRLLPLDRKILAQIRKGLEQVVASETGTGRLAQLAGIPVAAKTGTAQVPVGDPHAWFIGYAPADHPRFSFVVFLEHGGKGGVSAALVARDLLAYLHELGYL